MIVKLVKEWENGSKTYAVTLTDIETDTLEQIAEEYKVRNLGEILKRCIEVGMGL